MTPDQADFCWTNLHFCYVYC